MEILEKLSIKPFSIVGHRGAAGRLPENTLRAFQFAIEAGADVVECDVRGTKDGKLIVLHDKDFKRVAGIKKSPSEMTLEEIKKEVRVGGTEEVPTLEEVIELTNGRVGLFIEIKEPEISEKIAETVKNFGNYSWIAFVSFYEEALVKIKALLPDAVTGLIYVRPHGKIVEAKKLGSQIVLPQWKLGTEKAIAFAHKLGLKVVSWVINDENTAKEVLSRKADAMATDLPDFLVEFRRSLIQ